MRRLIVAVVLMLLVAGSAFAQLDFQAKSYYAQGMLTLPSGDFGDVAGTGFGGGVGMRVPYSEVLDFRGEIGYIYYGGKDFGPYNYSYNMIPVTVLGEYHLSADSPAYIVGGLGLTRVGFSFDGTYEILGYTQTIDESDSSMEFTFGAGGGYEVNEQFAVEGRFNIISDTNYISVHGLYAF